MSGSTIKQITIPEQVFSTKIFDGGANARTIASYLGRYSDLVDVLFVLSVMDVVEMAVDVLEDLFLLIISMHIFIFIFITIAHH